MLVALFGWLFSDFLLQGTFSVLPVLVAVLTDHLVIGTVVLLAFFALLSPSSRPRRSGGRRATAGQCSRRKVDDASTRFSARTALRIPPGHRGRDSPVAWKRTEASSTDLRKQWPAGATPPRMAPAAPGVIQKELDINAVTSSRTTGTSRTAPSPAPAHLDERDLPAGVEKEHRPRLPASPARGALRALAFSAASSPAVGDPRAPFTPVQESCHTPLAPQKRWYDAVEHRPLEVGAPGGLAKSLLDGPPGMLPETPATDEAIRLATLQEIDYLAKQKKAGPHILQRMRACGRTSVRAWLRCEAHPSLLKGPRATDLWTHAWLLDHDLSKAASPHAEPDPVRDICIEGKLRILAAAEMEARQRLLPREAQLMGSSKLSRSLVPFWLQRQARAAAKLELSWVRAGGKLRSTILGAFAPPHVEPDDDAEEEPPKQPLSGGRAVDACELCEETQVSRRRDANSGARSCEVPRASHRWPRSRSWLGPRS